MATWDGSCAVPEDNNYSVYPNYNAPEASRENCYFLPQNMHNGYLQTNHKYYTQNQPILEQNSAEHSYYSSSNVEGSWSEANNTYSEPFENSTDNVRNWNHLNYFSNDVKQERSYASDKYCHRNNKTKHHKVRNSSSTKDLTETANGIPRQTKVYSMSDEYVTNNLASIDKKYELENLESDCMAGPSFKHDCKPNNKYFFDNTGKRERKYNGKKMHNCKSRNDHKDDYYKGNTHTKSYQQQDKLFYKQSNNGHVRKHSAEGSQADVPSSTSTAPPYNKKNSLTALNEGEYSQNLNPNLDRYKRVLNEDNDGAINVGKDDNELQERNQHVQEHTYYNSGLKQTYNNYGGARKHSQHVKHTNEECRKNKRQNYQERWNKDAKYNNNNQSGNNDKYNDYKKCASEEINVKRREKKFKNHGYNAVNDNNADSKIQPSDEKNTGKNSVVSNKGKGYSHWRSERGSYEKGSVQRWEHNRKPAIDDDANQQERLADQLNRGQLECLVCCEYIKQADYTWSCSNCYHVLHLRCVKKWAKSSQADNGWRCPACQNVSLVIPDDYYCFCGKLKTPEWNRRDVAHSCGETCGKMLSKNTCPHKCTLLCHPGSCPPCTAMVTRSCGCGKTSQTVQCSAQKLLLCDSICGKDLNCGKHKCESICHHGDCSSCEKTITQECYCGKNKREVTCNADVPLTYSCQGVCDKLLDCGNHTCKKLCHEDACEPCSLTPNSITTCCCGQTLLTEERQSCLDPIPICDKICSKNLKCGQPNNPHKCKANCHQGDCPVCDLTTDVKCRCGNMDREVACKDLMSKADDARCEKRCTKKRSCGKHKCNQLCCIEIEHVCPLICSKTLSCGKHKCEQSCHKGRCQPCWRSSFDELYCECGASVIYPPVPCGTRRPTCDRPCSRQHSCGHEVLHNCHSEPTCPPCTVLTQRWCHGKHELRKAVPCYVNEISCGLPCNKPISCGRHKCISICHSGACEKRDQKCTQPCTTLRELCGHICAASCHDGKCPDIPCKEMVKVTCQCGHRTMTRACAENAKEYQRIASSILASKMADMQLGHSINLDQVFGQGAKKQNQLKTLECNDECKLIERNRRLALGLQIANPDLSSKLMPRYSDFMKQWAKKDPVFCQMVHEKLTELVQLAKISKQKSRSYSFECMNKDKRQFVHESCEHFGCESQAYDQEPKRNVVATAVKDKCWLPSYSLLEIVQRENGQRKVPGPMLNTSKTDGSVKTILSLPTKKSQKPDTQLSRKPSDAEIDYFNYQG